VCLIRDNLSTVWCEVTSSIRTRNPTEDFADDIDFEEITKSDRKPSPVPDTSSSKTAQSLDAGATPSEGEVQEILLCLRPIRDGDQKVDEKHRFVKKREVSDDSGNSNSAHSSVEMDNSRPSTEPCSGTGASSSELPEKMAPKKRARTHTEVGVSSSKRVRVSKKASKQAPFAENDIAESLMIMSNKNSDSH
jgi:hypothetical protein